MSLKKNKNKCKMSRYVCHKNDFFFEVPKHNVATQVFKDSIGIWVVVGYCQGIVTKLSKTGFNCAKYLLLRNARR